MDAAVLPGTLKVCKRIIDIANIHRPVTQSLWDRCFTPLLQPLPSLSSGWNWTNDLLMTRWVRSRCATTFWSKIWSNYNLATQKFVNTINVLIIPFIGNRWHFWRLLDTKTTLDKLGHRKLFTCPGQGRFFLQKSSLKTFPIVDLPFETDD